MDTPVKAKIISDDTINTFVMLLENKGMSKSEIDSFMMQIIAEVELEVVEELMTKLSDEKKKLLEALVSQDASGEEIVRQLELNEDELSEIEADKFNEIIGEVSGKLR